MERIMGKNRKVARVSADDAEYEASLRKLQIEFVKVQRHIIKHGHKVLVLEPVGPAALRKRAQIRI